MLIPFHVITGCDRTSGVYGRGKKFLFEKFQNDQMVKHLLHRVGELSDDMSNNMR